MTKGGYAMVDCTGLDLIKGSTEQTINGIYARTKQAMDANKPIYAYNCVWSTQGRVSPVEVFTVDFGDYIICTASTLQIVITKQDVVTINNMAPTEG